MLKKVMKLSLVMMLVLSFVSTASFADSNEIVESPADWELIVEKTFEVEHLYEEPLVKESNKKVKSDIGTFAVIGRKDFVVYDKATSTIHLKGMDSLGKLNVVGEHKITSYYKYKETWSVDRYGNKLSLVGTGPKTITSSQRTYDVMPPFTIWIDTWEKGIGTNKAYVEGHISSTVGGANSFYDSLVLY